MQLMAYVFSVLGLIISLVAPLIKGARMNLILILGFLSNAFIATSYLLEGRGINGAAACCLGAVIIFVNYFFEKDNKAIPKWLNAIYMLAFVAVNIWVVGGISFPCILSISACAFFVLCVGQKKGEKYRMYLFVNIVLWLIYDIVTGAYAVIITHGAEVVTILLGMFIHDRKGKNNKSSGKGEH